MYSATKFAVGAWLALSTLLANAAPAAGSIDAGAAPPINHGLVAAGELAADTRDFLGDTLGSFSSLAVARGSWRRQGAGYAGILWTLPDRGRNDPEAGLFHDYPSRLERMQLRLDARGVLSLQPTGGITLLDFDGKPFTGADPGQGTRVVRGHVLPAPAEGVGAGKISLDAEALAFTADGHFYVGDEYSANVYYFDAEGRLQGIIEPPAAIRPWRDGALSFGSLKAPQQGRRNNQGVEGLDVSPDGRHLFVALQSALVQDTASGDASGRRNARVLVYDIAKTPIPTKAIGHYVVPLPVYCDRGTCARPDRTAAQSELRVLDDHRFLLLARDSNGLGAGDDRRPVLKQVLLVDIADASNLAGTHYEAASDSVLAHRDSTALRAQIRPARTRPLVDLLDADALARFGLGLGPDEPGRARLSEKWEAMALVPALDRAHPDDALLLVGNDNDFIARDCVMHGTPCGSAYDNPNRVLVYRLTLPAR